MGTTILRLSPFFLYVGDELARLSSGICTNIRDNENTFWPHQDPGADHQVIPWNPSGKLRFDPWKRMRAKILNLDGDMCLISGSTSPSKPGARDIGDTRTAVNGSSASPRLVGSLGL